MPYSTVLWHADDYSQLMASGSVVDLKTCLEAGGKLWFVGWKPTGNLCNSIIYPFDFGPGSFIYDYLKISQVELSAADDSFQAAIGLLDYPRLDVDSAKVPIGSWAGTMRMIEALTSVAPGEDVYTIDMKNNSSPFEGLVCGVRYLGFDYKTAFFGFPLYFMKEEQARAVAQQVMTDFGEVYVAEEQNLPCRVAEFVLAPIIPNPSKGILKIKFILPDECEVTIKLYDVLGRQVKKIFRGNTKRGINEVSLRSDGLADGVYFVQLEVLDQKAMRKIILLKF